MQKNKNEKTVRYSVKDVQGAYEMLADYIVKRKPSHFKLLLVPIVDGGLMIFNGICRALDKRSVSYEYQSVSFRRYHGKEPAKGSIEFEKPFQGNWDGHLAVVIDDICDEGLTARLTFNHMLQTQGSGSGLFNLLGVFLVNRVFGSYNFQLDGIPCRSAFVAPHKEWFVGCGMDDNLKDRGAREIWSVKK